MSILSYLYLFSMTLVVSLLLGPIIIAAAKKANLNDTVNERSSHTTPTPRGGGLIFIVASAIILLLNLIHPFFTMPKSFNVILVLSFVCSLLGFLDDKYSLPSWFRLIVQVVLVTYPSIHLPLLFSHVPAYLQYILYAISWVWFINLFNFMDGTDGYAAQEALFILLFIAIVAPGLKPLSVLFIAAIGGFLKVNFPKASIFMGDSASYFLGYLLFGLMLYSFTNTPHLLIPCCIISMLFTADATYTLLKRIIKKESFFTAHRSHWYQRLYNIGYSHTYIFWLGASVNVFLLFLALCSVYFGYIVIDLLLSIIALFVLSIIIVSREKRCQLGVVKS